MVLCATAVLALANSLVLAPSPEFRHPSPSNHMAPFGCIPLPRRPLRSRRSLNICPLPVKCSVKILKRIPRASRGQAASKLATILDAIVSNGDHASWCRLLQFSARCFHVAREGARMVKRCSLASIVNRKLREEADPPVPRQSSRSNRQSTKNSPKDSVAYLVSRVSSNLEQGDFKGAVRLACSDATIADCSDSTFEDKHPARHPDSSIPPLADPMDLPIITVSEEEIIRAIRSFRNDSAGGPDGLRPQHLKDMTIPATTGGAQALISALSRFITVVLQGKTPTSICPFLGPV